MFKQGGAENMVKGPRIGVGRTAEVYAWGDHQILKLYPAEVPQEWVHHEARIGQIVAQAGVHAPAIGETVGVDGRLGILYERIMGPAMLDALAHQPWRLPSLARQFAQVGVGQKAGPAQGLGAQLEQRSDVQGLEHRVDADTVARLDAVVEIDRPPVGEDDLDLRVGHAPGLYQVPDRHRRAELDAEVALSAAGGQEIVELFVEADERPAERLLRLAGLRR